MTINNESCSRHATTGGKEVARYTTAQFAEHLLATVSNKVLSFTTSLKDMEAHSKLPDTESPVNPWPWYSVVVCRLFDCYSVHINRSLLWGGAAFVFDLPDYDTYKDELADLAEAGEVPEELMQAMIEGLTRFNKMYGETPDTWYVNDGDYDDIKILWNGKED